MIRSTGVSLVSIAAAGVLLLGSAGCGGGVEEREIRIERETSRQPSRAGIGASTAQRLSIAGGNPHGERQAGNPALSFHWDTPAGWKELAPKRFREINLLVAGRADAECFLTVLPGSAGGLAANVDRWRGQLSLAPLSAEEKKTLGEETRPLLGRQAVFVSYEGSYAGMGGAKKKEGYRLVGLVLEFSDGMIFVKMTGPKELIDKELPNFEALCASIRVVQPEQTSPSSAQASSGTLKWKAPAGWKRAPARQMREVTFRMGAGERCECYVAVLGGAAGGVAANVNRWRGQMEQKPLSAQELAALEKIEVLDRQATLVEIEGNFSGMGAESGENYMMLGLVCSLPGRAIFVKMIGPRDEVAAQRENFRAFCASLNEDKRG